MDNQIVNMQQTGSGQFVYESEEKAAMAAALKLNAEVVSRPSYNEHLQSVTTYTQYADQLIIFDDASMLYAKNMVEQFNRIAAEAKKECEFVTLFPNSFVKAAKSLYKQLDDIIKTGKSLVNGKITERKKQLAQQGTSEATGALNAPPSPDGVSVVSSGSAQGFVGENGETTVQTTGEPGGTDAPGNGTFSGGTVHVQVEDAKLFIKACVGTDKRKKSFQDARDQLISINLEALRAFIIERGVKKKVPGIKVWVEEV